MNTRLSDNATSMARTSRPAPSGPGARPAADVPGPTVWRRASRVFKALSHPDRLRIAYRLACGRPATQVELVHETGLSQPTFARHQAKLRDLGVIEVTRQGAEVRLTLEDPLVRRVVQAMCTGIDCGGSRKDEGDR
jgi:DNA-binding transcriptional ArsR family regulator